MTINCKGELIDLSTPRVMGILNITPDSFYDGGRYKEKGAILRQVDLMLKDGASFIDVGAYSSRPRADVVSEETELSRIEPVIDLLIDEYPQIIISVDTFRSKVAKRCVEAGASMINDISGGDLDRMMMQTAAKLKVPYIAMHMKGTPQDMSEQTQYDNLLVDIRNSFSEKLKKARELKINDLIIDPGFGFAKTREQNFQLLRELELFQALDLPLLIGLSRKSMIYKTLDIDADEALNGTTALHMIGLSKGANILRVHDVREAVECIRLYRALEGNEDE